MFLEPVKAVTQPKSFSLKLPFPSGSEEVFRELPCKEDTGRLNTMIKSSSDSKKISFYTMLRTLQ